MDSTKPKTNWFWPKIVDLDTAKQATNELKGQAQFLLPVVE